MDHAAPDGTSQPVLHPVRKSIAHGGSSGIAAGLGGSAAWIVLARFYGVVPPPPAPAAGDLPSPVLALLACLSLLVGAIPAALLAMRTLKKRNIPALPLKGTVSSVQMTGCRAALVLSFLVGLQAATLLPALVIIAAGSLR